MANLVVGPQCCCVCRLYDVPIPSCAGNITARTMVTRGTTTGTYCGSGQDTSADDFETCQIHWRTPAFIGFEYWSLQFQYVSLVWQVRLFYGGQGVSPDCTLLFDPDSFGGTGGIDLGAVTTTRVGDWLCGESVESWTVTGIGAVSMQLLLP
jgi:hypothetical protein